MDSFDLCGFARCLVSRLQLCFPNSAILSGYGFAFSFYVNKLQVLDPYSYHLLSPAMDNFEYTSTFFH